jgi:hypothetical protein
MQWLSPSPAAELPCSTLYREREREGVRERERETCRGAAELPVLVPEVGAGAADLVGVFLGLRLIWFRV